MSSMPGIVPKCMPFIGIPMECSLHILVRVNLEGMKVVQKFDGKILNNKR